MVFLNPSAPISGSDENKLIQSIPEAEEEPIKPTVAYQNGPSNPAEEADEVLKLVNPQDTAKLLNEGNVVSKGINGIINGGDQQILINGDAHRT